MAAASGSGAAATIPTQISRIITITAIIMVIITIPVRAEIIMAVDLTEADTMAAVLMAVAAGTADIKPANHAKHASANPNMLKA
jgi:hypothetical protein